VSWCEWAAGHPQAPQHQTPPETAVAWCWPGGGGEAWPGLGANAAMELGGYSAKDMGRRIRQGSVPVAVIAMSDFRQRSLWLAGRLDTW